MRHLIQVEINKAVQQIFVGMSPRYLVCANFEPGDMRAEVLPEQCARAKQVLKQDPQRIVGCYCKGDSRRVRRDLETRASEK